MHAGTEAGQKVTCEVRTDCTCVRMGIQTLCSRHCKPFTT